MSARRGLKKRIAPVVFASCVAWQLSTTHAHAQVLDRFALHAEGGGGGLLTGEQTQRFGPGGDAIARLSFRIVGPLHIQASALSAWFVATNNGAAGRLYAFEGGLRLAPIVSQGVLGGPVLDANAGIAITGGLQRFAFDVGVAWLFRPTRFFGIGPAVRYVHVVQPDDQPSPDDAMMLFGGIALSISAPAPTHATETESTTSVPPPPRDTDHDGVPDANDRCPMQPEDIDGFQDDDGCPDPDNDNDGFADASDHCPTAAETRNGFEDDDGCPDTPPPPPPPQTSNERAMEEIGNHILFGNGLYRLRGSVRPAIAEMCRYLGAHPEIVRVRVEGHADERGSEDFNQELSAYRAAAVARALVHCGVASERIESAGMGSTHRLCQDRGRECLQRNRRVQFEIIERRASTEPTAQ